jgi:hypothetical protein
VSVAASSELEQPEPRRCVRGAAETPTDLGVAQSPTVDVGASRDHLFMENTWIRVPIGTEAHRWTTITPTRTVLVVVRTATTVAWLFDLLPELLGDPRVQVVFTVNGQGSAYEAGVIAAVERLGGRIVPWAQAIGTRFDLAISASHHGGLDQLRSPLLIIPHGPGHTKFAGLPASGHPAIPSVLPSSGPATTIAVTHKNQREHWAAHRKAGVRTVVVGDPCFDRLRSSASQVELYREALRVRPQQRLVVVSSTWGPRSLIGVHPTLLEDLLANLPMDQYIVAAILHPNVWVGHGSWQLRTWIRRAIEGGLRLIPYLEGWRGTLVSADCLIGDHGSVTFYGAALGVPTVLGTFGAAEIVPTAPLGQLGRRAPRLDRRTSVRRQLELSGFRREPGRYRDLVHDTFAHPGDALQRLRHVAYDLMELDAPSEPARVLAVSCPDPEYLPPTAMRVGTPTVTRTADRQYRLIGLTRFPACIDVGNFSSGETDHLAVDIAEPDSRLRQSASVIFGNPSNDFVALSGPEETAMSWTASVLGRYPGCLVAAASINRRTALISVRGGNSLRVSLDRPGVGWVSGIGSAVYSLLITRRLDTSRQLDVSVQIGDATLQFHLKPIKLPPRRSSP